MSRLLSQLRIAIIATIAALAIGSALAWRAAVWTSGVPASSPRANAAVEAHFPPDLILLDPPGQNQYVPHAVGATITAQDGRPVAQFLHTPPGLANAVSAEIPNNVPVAVSVVAWQILSSIRYQGGAHTVYVTTARPSAAAAPPGSIMTLGNASFQLPDGSTAWTKGGLVDTMPNEVRWLRNGLIITVGGNLTVDELKTLAAQVTVLT